MRGELVQLFATLALLLALAVPVGAGVVMWACPLCGRSLPVIGGAGSHRSAHLKQAGLPTNAWPTLAARYAGLKLTFSDEFDGAALDKAKWLLNYNRDPAMPCRYTMNGGVLRLRLDEPPVSGMAVSAIQTDMLPAKSQEFGQTYGRFEIRMKCAPGSGLCSAFFLAPANAAYEKDTSLGGTRKPGDLLEMDFEQLGRDPKQIQLAAHHGLTWGGSSLGKRVDETWRFSDGFHVYAINWTPAYVTCLIDGAEVWRVLKSAHDAFYVTIALYGGATWMGPVDKAGTWPRRMDVDWVRVYGKT
jgi:beta-glucanase (GH16 family)